METIGHDLLNSQAGFPKMVVIKNIGWPDNTTDLFAMMGSGVTHVTHSVGDRTGDEVASEHHLTTPMMITGSALILTLLFLRYAVTNKKTAEQPAQEQQNNLLPERTIASPTTVDTPPTSFSTTSNTALHVEPVIPTTVSDSPPTSATIPAGPSSPSTPPPASVSISLPPVEQSPEHPPISSSSSLPIEIPSITETIEPPQDTPVTTSSPASSSSPSTAPVAPNNEMHEALRKRWEKIKKDTYIPKRQSTKKLTHKEELMKAVRKHQKRQGYDLSAIEEEHQESSASASSSSTQTANKSHLIPKLPTKPLAPTRRSRTKIKK